MRTQSNSRNGKHTQPEITFTSGSIAKSMLVFVGPFMLGILLQNLYGAVDLFVVGHYATTVDVSAVTIGSQLMTTVTQAIIGLATGITVLIGQAWGAKDHQSLSRTTGASIMLFGSVAAVLTAVYLGLHTLMVSAMQTPPEAVAATRAYLFACGVGIPFIIGYNVVTSILTGLGDSKTPFLFVAVACVINIVLDVTLVRYLHLGAFGAAVATTAAQAGSFLFSMLFLRRRGLGFALSRKDIRLDRVQMKRLAKIGGPVAIQNVLVGASFLFVTAIINQMGLVASAAVGVVEKLITFLFVPATAMGTAVGTASAQNLGAQQYRRARKAMWCGIAMALIPSVVVTVFCQFGGQLLTGILAKDAAVRLMAAQYLRSYILDVVLVSFVFCMNGYFNSCGKSWFSLLHSLATTFAVRVPGAYLLSRLPNTNLFLIGWAAPASTLLSLVLCVVFLFRLQQQEAEGVPAAASQPRQSRETGRKVIVTISREYGSGGRLIGEKVAERLAIPFYNRNLIDLTANRSGLAEGYIAKWEEQISSRFIWHPAVGTRGAAGQMGSYYSNEDKMFATQTDIIRELAEHSCVIVGRCADYILQKDPHCIRVFIHAHREHKRRRLVEEYGIPADKAGEIAANTDQGRANYYRHYTGLPWGDARQYHLVLDSGLFGIDRAAQLIVDSVVKLYPEFLQ